MDGDVVDDIRSLGGYSHAALVPVSATFLAIVEVVTISFIIIYWHRRHTHPINAREPFFTIAGSVLGCLLLLVDGLDKILGVDLPCEIVLFSGNLFLHGLMASYAMRPLSLLFKFRDTAAKMREFSLSSRSDLPQRNDSDQKQSLTPENADAIVDHSDLSANEEARSDGTELHNCVNSTSPTELHMETTVGNNEDQYSADNKHGHPVKFADSPPSSRRQSISQIWVKHRVFWRTTGLYKIWVCLLILHLVLGLASVVFVASTDGCSRFEDAEIPIGVIVVLYSCFYIYLGVKIKRCGVDNFGFKRELMWLGIDGLVVILLWAPSASVPALLDIDQNHFTYTDLVINTGVFVSFFFTLAQPLRQTYRFEKYAKVSMSELTSATRANAPNSFDSNRGSVDSHQHVTTGKDTERRRTITLNQVLSSRRATPVFRDFLATEFAVENLSFWLSVQHYKSKLHSLRKKHGGDVCEINTRRPFARARRLARRYIQEGALFEINIPFRHKESILTYLGMSTIEKSFHAAVEDDNFWSDPDNVNLDVRHAGHTRAQSTSNISRISRSDADGGSSSEPSGADRKDIAKLSTLFDDAQSEVFKLLKRDSFPRFLRSELSNDIESIVKTKDINLAGSCT